MATTPLVIHIYDSEDNPQEFTRAFVPWKLLKLSLQVAKLLDGKSAAEMNEKDLDVLSGLIVEAFGNRFSIADLDNGGDVTEMMAVMQNIIARAQGTRPNGLPPA